MKEPESSDQTGTEDAKPMDVCQRVSDTGMKFLGRFKLQTILTVSIVLIFILAIGITTVISYQNNQYAIYDLANQLQDSIIDRIVNHLDNYLEIPHRMNKLCVNSISNGELDIHDNVALKRYFQKMSYLFPTSESICYANEEDGNYTIVSAVGKPGIAHGNERFWAFSGPFTNYTLTEYRITKTGELLEKTLELPDYDPRKRPWYQAAVKAGGPAWSDIYMWLEGVVSIDATLPVYSSESRLEGIVDTSLTLTGIGEYLQGLNISRNGQAFIIDKNGMLVASSVIKEPYKHEKGELVRLSALDCNNSVIQDTTRFLQQNGDNGLHISHRQQFRTDINGQSQFILVTPYNDLYGLEWVIVIIIPESDFMDRVNKNAMVTLALILSAIAITTLICIILARWITRPILSMNISARALARGDWGCWKVLDRKDELGELSFSFKQMADQLQEMFSSLKASEEQYICLFQFSADSILLLEEGRLITINHAGEEMFSVVAPEVTGKDINCLFGNVGPGIAQLIEAAGTKHDREYWESTIQQIKNGNEQYINIRLTQVQTAGRDLILVHLRDITDQRRAIIISAEQESLRESYLKIKMILQLLPDPTIVIDNNNQVLFWNHAMEELTGVSEEEVIRKGGSSYSRVLTGLNQPVLIDIALHPELLLDRYPNLEKTGEILRATDWVEIQNVRRYLSAIASRLYDKEGHVTGAIESIRDITNQKMSEESLLLANNKLNLLSSITRHDIQNKVMIAKSHLYLMKESSLSLEQFESAEAIDRSMMAIEHFIAFTKTYQELGVNLPVWQDIGVAFSQAAKELDMGDVVIHNTVHGIQAYTDPLLGKVCYNLIENAIRHGETVTRIDISSYETPEGLVISVADDGCGIEDDLKEMIFERGYGKNTGFGLFLVREILSISEVTIKEHGRFGEGARFDIVIPHGKFRIDDNRYQ